MKNQTIGVEIEMTGITRKEAAEAVAKYFGTRVKVLRDGYSSYGAEDKQGRMWKFSYDSSIKAQKKTSEGKIKNLGDWDNENDYKVELVTPILKYEDIETLQEIVRTVKEAGAFVNKSGGMHVHIGANGFTAKSLKNLLKYVASREQNFYAAVGTYESRKRYCKPADERIIAEVVKKNPKTLEQFKNIWYNGEPSRANRHYDNSRYTVLNLHAFFSKGTIEYRLFNATLHAGEVKSYVQFCLAVTNFAKTANSAVYKAKTDRFAERMQMILEYVGLTGEEFKTCRYHMLKNLKESAVAIAVA